MEARILIALGETKNPNLKSPGMTFNQVGNS
jgi:hypothetical protein